jgi:hypothetical protein
MGWLSNLHDKMLLHTLKGDAERAVTQMYGNGQAAEDACSDSWIIDDLNKEPSGTTLSDMMERHGKIDYPMRDVLRSPDALAERDARMEDAKEEHLWRKADEDNAKEDAELARQDSLSAKRQDAEVTAMEYTPKATPVDSTTRDLTAHTEVDDSLAHGRSL